MRIEFDKFVADLLDSHEYWVFEVQGDDWHYLLGRIDEEFFASEPQGSNDNFGLIFPNDDGSPVCWAARSHVPVEVIAFRFGLSPAVVLGSGLIKLRPFPSPPKKSTVNYFGTA